MPSKKIPLILFSTLLTLSLALAGIFLNAREPVMKNGGTLSPADAAAGTTLVGWEQTAPNQWSFAFTPDPELETLVLCMNYQGRLLEGGTETEQKGLYHLRCTGDPIHLTLQCETIPVIWVSTPAQSAANEELRQLFQLLAIACFGMTFVFVLALFYYKHQRELGYFLFYLAVMLVWSVLIYRFPAEDGELFRLLSMLCFSFMLLAAIWLSSALLGLPLAAPQGRVGATVLAISFGLLSLSPVPFIRVGTLIAGMLYCQLFLLRAYWKELEGASQLLLGCAVTTGLRVWVVLPSLRLPFFLESLDFYILRCSRIYDLPFALGCMIFVCRRFAQQFDRTEQLARELDRRVAQRTQALAEQVEARESMMLNIFHDLRSPLFAVSNGLDTLTTAPDLLPDLLPALRERMGFLRRLTEDLFLAAKLEQKQVMLNEDQVMLNEQTALVCGACQAEANKKGVTLRADTTQPLLVWGDAVRLQQVVQNLVTNAIYYTPTGGQVEVICRAGEGAALVSVRDTGCGIPPEEQAAVFQRYFRTTNGRKHESTGLGLTIAQELAHLHQGEILLESEVGKGSCFTLRLPLLELDEEADE